MSAQLYASAWRTSAQLAHVGLRLGIAIAEAALMMMRMADRSLSSTAATAPEVPPSRVKPTQVRGTGVAPTRGMSPKAARAKAMPRKAASAPPSSTRPSSAKPSAARAEASEIPAERPVPAGAVLPEQTVHDEYVVCLEDGKRFKALKGHLRAAHDLSPEQYRAKWGLTADHPISAPAYSARRSTMAKQARSGKVGRDTSGSRSRQVRTAA